MENTAARKTAHYDVIVIGGGPAGLSCALVLGRCKRKVLVCDSGFPRNRFSQAMHSFLSLDGEHPKVFLDRARQELKKYGVHYKRTEVVTAQSNSGGFLVTTKNGSEYVAKKLVLATGISDTLPAIGNISRFYGKTVLHCPYCDGWEFNQKAWVVYAVSARAAVEICLRYKTWSDNITLLAAHCVGLNRVSREKLRRNGIKLCDEKAIRLSGTGNKLELIHLANGQTLKADVLFFSTPQKKPGSLTQQLGCECNKKGAVCFNRHQQTNVPGVFVAGDLGEDMQLVVIAAAEGAKAAVVINTLLNKEERVF